MKRWMTALLLPLLLLTGCTRSVPRTDAPLEAFSFSHTGMSTDQIFGYRVYRSGGQYLADFDLYCRFEVQGVVLDEADAAALRQLIEDANLWQWNGFAGRNNYVLDGEGFGLTVTFRDGTTLSAQGSNAFPKGYGEGAGAITRYFQALMDKHGIDPCPDE